MAHQPVSWARLILRETGSSWWGYLRVPWVSWWTRFMRPMRSVMCGYYWSDTSDLW